MERIIANIQFLLHQYLALKSTSDKLYEQSNINFFKTVEMLGQPDWVICEDIHYTEQLQDYQKDMVGMK